jgi:hypothetical protein
MTTKTRCWKSLGEAALELREERRRVEKGAAKIGRGITLFIEGWWEASTEASWLASMAWFEGAGYQSQEGEGVRLWSIDEGSS